MPAHPQTVSTAPKTSSACWIAFFDVRLVGDVGADEFDARTAISVLVGDRLSGGVTIDDDDLGALGSERVDAGSADSRGAARHHRDATAQLHVHRDHARWRVGGGGDGQVLGEGDGARVDGVQPTVDWQHGGVDVGRRRGQEPRDGGGNLGRVRRSRQWRERGGQLVGLLTVDAPLSAEFGHLLVGHLRARPRRADDVGAHPLWSVVHAHGLDEHREPRLRGVVGGVPGGGPQPAQRRHADHGSLGVDQMGEGVVQQAKRCGEVGVHRRRPILFGEFGDRPRANDACVEHDRVEPPEAVHGAVDQPANCLRIGHVDGTGVNGRLGRHPLQRFEAAAADDDRPTLVAQGLGGCRADAAATTGDE